MFASYSDTEKRTAEIMDTDDGKIPNYCQVLRFKDANGQIKEMVFPKALDLDRPKRPRTTFSDNQLSILEKEFQKNPYLIGKDRTRLAATLELTETQIKVWFQNRRTKSKKDKTGVDGEKDKTLDNLAESRSWSLSPVCPNSPKLPNGKSLGSVASMKMPLSLSEECKASVNGQYLSQLPIPVQAQMQNPLQMYSSNFSPLPYMYPMFPVTQVLRR